VHGFIRRKSFSAEARRRPGAVPAVLLVVAATGTSLAQISPGPLSAPHASLDSSRGCLECHGAGDRSLDDRCLECHVEIANRVSAASGLHGREASSDCASCHPEHGGRAFDLIEWTDGSAEKFDHGRTGWQLTGRHAKARCRTCHKPQNITEGAAREIGRARPARTWLGLETRCGTCHEDLHANTLGDTCSRCHDSRAWKPAQGFDHDATAYALTGEHVETACDRCHLVPGHTELALSSGRTAPLYRPLPHDECSDCHADVHAGALGPVCAGCHVTASFRTVDREAFDHARTRYPLQGAHRRATCGGCHDAERAWGRKPPFQTCSDCHRDVHRGEATLAGRAVDCASCHDLEAFRPSTFTALAHADSPYPLEGKHGATKCRDCHARGVSESRPAFEFRLQYDLCSRCHADGHDGQLESQTLRASGRPAPAGGDCSGCHHESGWRPSTFDATRHGELGLPLAGGHAKIECGACHGHVVARLRPVDPACAACHADPHGGRVMFAGSNPAADCGRCHDAGTFRPSLVDANLHGSLGYPLEGAHRTVPCIACHPSLASAPARSTLRKDEIALLELTRTHDRCVDCHTGPHLGQFQGRPRKNICEACHSVNDWRPASGFDHDRDAGFVLGAAHRGVRCAACHVPGPGESAIRYAAAPSRCEACHGSSAAPLPADMRVSAGGTR
jgi:hypothetical protein